MVLLRRSALLPLDGVDHDGGKRIYRGDFEATSRCGGALLARRMLFRVPRNRNPRQIVDEIVSTKLNLGLGGCCTPSRWLILLRGIILRWPCGDRPESLNIEKLYEPGNFCLFLTPLRTENRIYRLKRFSRVFPFLRGSVEKNYSSEELFWLDVFKLFIFRTRKMGLCFD